DGSGDSRKNGRKDGKKPGCLICYPETTGGISPPRETIKPGGYPLMVKNQISFPSSGDNTDPKIIAFTDFLVSYSQD
ncbi:MAG: hypothetical protein PHD25_12515, partial [Bacteroidales bacterium]|nr:hypothetical protein [Bacteroidales bacterium]